MGRGCAWDENSSYKAGIQQQLFPIPEGAYSHTSPEYPLAAASKDAAQRSATAGTTMRKINI